MHSTQAQIRYVFRVDSRYCFVSVRSILVRVEILRSHARARTHIHAHAPLYYRSHQDLYTHHCSIQFMLYILSSLNLCADSPIPFAFNCVALSIAHMSLKDFFFLVHSFVRLFHSYIDSKHLIAIS